MGLTASFIIPVYNGERYLDACIANILSQTMKLDTIEAIFVNDGSVDGSLTILRDYADKHPDLIRVVTQKNMGAGEARNKAIKIAQGDYIIPIDCDDVINKDYASVLVDTISKTDADYAISGYNTVNEKFDRLTTILPKDDYFTRFRLTLTCGKIYRKTFLTKNNITYTRSYIMEDPYFNVICAMKARTVSVVKYAGYDVIMRPKVKGQLTSSTMIRDNNPYIQEMINGFIANNKEFAQKQPSIFRYILAKFTFNNLLANKLSYSDARKGLNGQLALIGNAGYSLRAGDLFFGTKGESIITKTIIGSLALMYKFGLLGIFYKMYVRFLG